MLDPVAGSIERYMDVVSARQKVVAANIANADTPGYLTRDIDFASELQEASRTQASASGPATPRVVTVAGLPVKNDGNNVSLDREARLLSENALRFNIAAQFMRSQIRAVQSALEEGKSA